MPGDWLRSGRVRLIPDFPRAELPALLADHDAGLFTSEAEGWGLSLSEMLESGLPVFATEAGAVGDLRPFFPGSLLPFPPPLPPELPAAPPDLEANGYYQRMSWAVIAERYESEVLADLCAS
jgi:Glycosyl transferases group 1